MTIKSTIFIADLHLQNNNVEIFKLWQNFIDIQINQNQYKPEALYILGDFFAVWAGDDDLTAFNKQIITSISNIVKQGTKVYMICGNRDFLLGKKFAELSQCILLKDPTVIDLYGTPTLLTHGDMLCTKDILMRIFRNITRHAIFRTIFMLLPLSLRKKIAYKIYNMSQKSRQHNTKNQEIFAVDDCLIKHLLHKYNAQQIIHGHIHQKISRNIELQNGKYAKHYVLNEWNNNTGYDFLIYRNT